MSEALKASWASPLTGAGAGDGVLLFKTDDRRLTPEFTDAGLGEAAERAVAPLANVVDIGAGEGPVRLGVPGTLGEVVVMFVKRVVVKRP